MITYYHLHPRPETAPGTATGVETGAGIRADAELGLESGSELVGSRLGLGSGIGAGSGLLSGSGFAVAPSQVTPHQVTLGYTITSEDVQRGVLALSACFHPSANPRPLSTSLTTSTATSTPTPTYDQYGLLSPLNYEPSQTVIKLRVNRQVTPHPTHISLEWRAPSAIEYGTILTGIDPPPAVLYITPVLLYC